MSATTAKRKHMTEPSRPWPLYEVFIRSRNGLDHKHCGSVHAPDAKIALQNARDVYTRRMEGVSIWVVRASTSRVRPGCEGRVLRPGRRQDLPAPDVLRAAG
jgi:1,2-phenylacetyl-CoA epoxidase PaaB subunit